MLGQLARAQKSQLAQERDIVGKAGQLGTATAVLAINMVS